MTAQPLGWRTVRLGDVADTALGKMLDASRPKGTTRVPYLRNVNVQWGRIDLSDVSEVPLSDDELQRFALADGDLLVCEGGEVGRAAIWRGGRGYMAYQKALHRVRAGDDLDLKFLRYLLEHYAETGELGKRATGSTILHLPQQRLRELPIPLPPLDEQHRIVDILEDNLSRLEAAAAQVSSAERRLENWKRQSLDRLVRETASGRTALATLVRRIEAGRSFGGSAPPAAVDEWGIIKVSAMTWGEFRPDENKAVAADKVDPRFEIRQGDVLVSRANTTEYVGAPVFVETTRDRLLLSDKSLRIVPAAGIEARWLATVLAARSSRQQVSRLATGTKDSMRNISQQALLSIAVPSATPAQQAHVMDRAVMLEETAVRLRSDLIAARGRATRLRQSLLSAAFSGRLSCRPRNRV
jgi:type I restriction enzyme S subunit